MKPAIVLALLTLAALARADQITKVDRIAGTELHYKVIVPKGYDPAKAYPTVLAFPGGAQTLPMVDSMIARNWRLQAEARGYLVVVAAAPAEGLFYAGGAKVFPAFLDKLLADYKVEGGRFHIAGISNGGITAFHVAASYPKYFRSVTGFPGYLRDASPARVDALKDMCINMYVGETDTGWVASMEEQSGLFRSKGFNIRYTVERGQGHVMRTLENAGASRLFDQFEECR